MPSLSMRKLRAASPSAEKARAAVAKKKVDDDDLVTIGDHQYARSFKRGSQPKKGMRLSPEKMKNPDICPNGWQFNSASGNCEFHGRAFRDSDWVVAPSGHSGHYPDNFGVNDFPGLIYLRCKEGRKGTDGKCHTADGRKLQASVQVCPSSYVSYTAENGERRCMRNRKPGAPGIDPRQWAPFMDSKEREVVVPAAAATPAQVAAAVPAAVVAAAPPAPGAVPAVVVAPADLPAPMRSIDTLVKNIMSKTMVPASYPVSKYVQYAGEATDATIPFLNAADTDALAINKSVHAKYGGSPLPNGVGAWMPAAPGKLATLMPAAPTPDMFTPVQLTNAKMGDILRASQTAQGGLLRQLFVRWCKVVEVKDEARRFIPKYRMDAMDAVMKAINNQTLALPPK